MQEEQVKFRKALELELKKLRTEVRVAVCRNVYVESDRRKILLSELLQIALP